MEAGIREGGSMVSDLHTIFVYCSKIHSEAYMDYLESGDRMDLGRSLGIEEVRSYCMGILSMREGTK